MRLKYYLKENTIGDALAIEEPEVGKKYGDALVAGYIETLEAAIEEADGLPTGSDKNAIIADLQDKLDKWKNLEKELEPSGPNLPPELTTLPPEPPPEKKTK